jgi:transposase InsO family protein
LKQQRTTDLTNIKVQGRGMDYLPNVPDDCARNILAWALTPTMAATDVRGTIEKVLARAMFRHVWVWHRPPLLSDRGLWYVSGLPRRYLESPRMGHTLGRPHHTMTEGKIEHDRRSTKCLIQM